MDRTQFKNFKALAESNINELGYMGYAWINLTEKQMNQMCDLADKQGLKQNENGWYQLENGIQFKRV